MSQNAPLTPSSSFVWPRPAGSFPSKHFGHPFAGFSLATDFFIAACRFSLIFNPSGFGPEGLLDNQLPY
jgi:hypothetical protein